MSYLVDSDWVADWLKGRQVAIDLLTALAPDGLAISIITLGEIYEGIYYGQNRQRHERGFRQFRRLVKVLPITERRQALRRHPWGAAPTRPHHWRPRSAHRRHGAGARPHPRYP